uniref:NADH-ubiquinone oxidoreductase chain 2 n=1 Tax=Diurodrilus subterraneus TaxID=1318637 RepID=M9W6K9_9ANNE|nr:NADH dehydrogenase subunit 2 [Diurodrilus subterraneus]
MSIIGLLISSFASSWLLVWVGLELNSLVFIPIMMSSFSHSETEASIKYFLAQALASSLILFSLIYSYFNALPAAPNICLILGLLTKLGLPPFYTWYPNIASLMSWLKFLMLSSWQKIPPLFLLISSSIMSPIMTTLIALFTLLISISALNILHLRPLLALSSILHLSWILCAAPSSTMMAWIYTMFYMLMSLFLLTILIFSHYFTLTCPPSLSKPLYLLSMITFILSMMSIPPLPGFFIKLLILILSSTQPIMFMFLIFSTMISLYFYSSILLSLSLPPSHSSYLNKTSILLMIITSLFFIPLLLII